MLHINRIEIIWLGNSLNKLKKFPKKIKQSLGAELRRLQNGEFPLKSRQLKSIGSKVFEIKEEDERAWYRVIYVSITQNQLFILHCFEKRSRKTSKKDLIIAKQRYKQINLLNL